MNNRKNDGKAIFCHVKITHAFCDENGEKFKLYGLKATISDKEYDFPDLTYDYDKIKELAGILDKKHIGYAHLCDIIEDFVDSLHFYKI